MSDEFMTYDDIMEDLANDRDDTYDPEFRDPEGYCEHGTYVGGCGADLMCQWCEDGISLAEARRIVTAERTRKTRETAERTAKFINDLLVHGMGGIDVYTFAQDSSFVGNPLSRYGRH